MKRIFSRFLVVSLLLLITVAVFGCGKSSQESGDEDGKKSHHLLVWVSEYVNPEEQKKPTEEWYINKAAKRFEALNPGVTVEVVHMPDAQQVHQTFKAAGLAKNGPDIVQLWTGNYVNSVKDVLLNLDGKVQKEDMDNIIGWDFVREDLKPDGKILAFPSQGTTSISLIYNKKLVAAAGLDFDTNPPRTMDAFNEALEKIKNTGVTPIVSDEAQFPMMLYWLSNYWWAQVAGFDHIMSENSGKSKFAEDNGLLNALKAYQNLYTKGYMNKDIASSSDAMNRFFQGKAAIVLENASLKDFEANLGAENIGMILPPDMPDAKIKDSLVGGVGSCLGISSYTKEPDLSLKFISFLNSKAEFVEFSKVYPLIPIRKDFTTEELGYDKDPLLAQKFKFAQKSILYPDNVVDAYPMQELAQQAPLIMMGKLSPEEIAQTMDKKVAEKTK